jgi:hypothetical protein
MSAPTRKAVLWGTAAVVTAWAGWIVWRGDEVSQGVVAPRATTDRAPARTPRPVMAIDGAADAVAVSTSASASASATGLPAGERLAVDSERDAFGTRNWLAPPPPPPKAAPAPVEVVAAPIAPPPPPPPTLPYRFVGMLAGEPAGRPQVFLALGEKLLVAAPGDVLDGGFRLETVRNTELVFTHVQQGLTVRMPLSGVPS